MLIFGWTLLIFVLYGCRFWILTFLQAATCPQVEPDVDPYWSTTHAVHPVFLDRKKQHLISMSVPSCHHQQLDLFDCKPSLHVLTVNNLSRHEVMYVICLGGPNFLMIIYVPEGFLSHRSTDRQSFPSNLTPKPGLILSLEL